MSNKILNIQPLGFPWQTQDPFLFCAYHRDEYPAGNDSMGLSPSELGGRHIGSDFVVKDGYRMYHGSKMPGFPFHPHRGFETITINKEGAVDHSDSLGAAGRFMGGDVQWMTAGKGIQHSEMFPLLNAEEGNPLEIFQIWLNLPKASKMVEPHFKMLWKEDIPVLTVKDAEGRSTVIDLIAGNLQGIDALSPTPDSWAANEANGVRVLTVKMEANAEWTLLKNENSAVSRTLFFYKGDTLSLEGQEIQSDKAISAVGHEDLSFVNGSADSYLLILEGQAINEPVVQHGPFVMNTKSEIIETMEEYQRTQFGGWPWEEREVAFPRGKGRFALHSDGREEVR